MMLHKKQKAFFIHLAVWVLYGFIFISFFKEDEIVVDYYFKIRITIINLMVFYGVYFSAKKYLFNRRYFLFVATLVIVLLGATLIRVNSLRPEFEVKPKETRVEMRTEQFDFPKYKAEHFDHGRFFHRKIIVDFINILLIALLAMIICFIQKWQNDEKQKLFLIKEKSDAELQFLKQQINPHFLFNSLNSIYSLANKKSDLTTAAILKLSTILRYVIYHSHKDLVSLKDEVETINNYIELQQLRLTSKVKLTYNTFGDLGPFLIEPLLIIPILENTFKHGVDNVNESFINISIKIEDGYVRLLTENKIVAVNKKITEESGIGLQNIKRRLEILYPNEYELIIKTQDEVYILDLKIKLKQ